MWIALQVSDPKNTAEITPLFSKGKDVAHSGPAKNAGIIGQANTTVINGRPITLGGDIILKIDNKNIQNIHDILEYIEGIKNVGDSILVTVLRNEIVQYNTVKLGSNPNYLPHLNR